MCSQGERARVRLARALMADPLLLLLDEPFAGLDLPGREDLLMALENLEEIPATATHALMVRRGKVTGAGPIDEVLTDEGLSACYERDVQVHRIDGRWAAHAARRS
ncbi:ATP-binding cassette domain-containing protein [Amycolatopsis speibonae]|uniref:ATP-binding cassette domain-containing protein n=1 Tax=Amycolatopsis speibonae TaxID=1450224 RepID=A0ABV7NQ80_9PSEU